MASLLFLIPSLLFVFIKCFGIGSEEKNSQSALTRLLEVSKEAESIIKQSETLLEEAEVFCRQLQFSDRDINNLMATDELPKAHQFLLSNRFQIASCINKMHKLYVQSLLALTVRAQKVAAYMISDSQRIMSCLIGIFFINTQNENASNHMLDACLEMAAKYKLPVVCSTTDGASHFKLSRSRIRPTSVCEV